MTMTHRERTCTKTTTLSERRGDIDGKTRLGRLRQRQAATLEVYYIITNAPTLAGGSGVALLHEKTRNDDDAIRLEYRKRRTAEARATNHTSRKTMTLRV